MGAVSGLADIESPHAAKALIAELPNLRGRLRELAIDALLRSPQGTEVTLA